MTEQTEPLISIVTPAYNAAAVIGDTIKSVLAQSYTRWELLVVDDGSTDNTSTVVRSFSDADERIRLITMPMNCGAPARPRNTAVKEAKGSWIAFLDADDIWHPLKLEKQLDALIRANAKFGCTSMRDFRNLADIQIASPSAIDVEEITFSMQQLKGRIPASSVMIATEVALQYPFNEEMSYKAVEDYHCWLRVLEAHGPCVKLLYPLLMYRRLANQISGSKMYMLGRMYNVHLNYKSRRSRLRALFFSATHVLGGVYFRAIKGSL